MAGVATQLAGYVPSKHKALGFIPSTGINLVWWRRPVIPALRRRLSYLPEITQLVRSKDRSQRALSWVPSLFRPTMSFPAGSSWAGGQREQERMWRKSGREKARVLCVSMKLRAGGQTEPGGASKAWGTMCVWQLGITLEGLFPADSPLPESPNP